MGAKEDFSSSLQLETSESIRGDLSEAKNLVSLYKKAVEVLGEMERNFDNALGNNAYDYFDGNVDTDVDKTEFEKKAQELSTKAKELDEQISIGSTLYAFAKSKLGISSVEQQQLDSLAQELLRTQEKAKQQIESDLEDGKLDEESHIAPDFVDSNSEEAKEGSKSIIEVKTQGGHQFRFTSLKDYNPPTSPQKIEITDPNLKRLIEGDITLIGDAAHNINKTDPEEFKEWLVEYLSKVPNILRKYGIVDYKHLTPKQAIQLASEITTRHLDYDDNQVNFKENNPRYSIFFDHDNDTDSVDELFEEGAGICSNYTHAVKVVFDSLKVLQNPDNNKLINVYASMEEAADSNRKNGKNAARREIVDWHQWNTFYTVSPSGEVQGLVVDATLADEKGKDMKNPDYTDSRFLFNLERMVIEGLLTREQKIAHLEKWCQNPENENSPSYKAATQEIGDYYFRQEDQTKGLDWYFRVPSMKDLARIQDDYDISKIRIQDFVTDPKNVENVQFASFFAEYFYDKEDYEKVIDFALKDPNKNSNWDQAIKLVYSCIQCKNEKFKSWTNSLPQLILKNKQDFMKENYPKEAKIIIAKYGEKTT